MSVFNNEYTLSEAIESILSQSFADFEFIIVDDCSTDHSREVVESFSDERIRFYKNESNKGLAVSLNKGLKMCSGGLIARMDGDDICHPERLSIQRTYMLEHPGVGICGTWVQLIGDTQSRIKEYPLTHEAIQVKLLTGTPLAHPSVMMRKSILEKYDLYYNETYTVSQDYELWYRASKSTRLANISRPLLKYRIHSQQVSETKKQNQRLLADAIREKQLVDLGVEVTRDILQKHQNIFSGHCMGMNLIEVHTWLKLLWRLNKKNKIYSQRLFVQLLRQRWVSYILKKPTNVFRYFTIFTNSVFSHPFTGTYYYVFFKAIKMIIEDGEK